MTDRLPHNLLTLFAPRPSLRYLEPIDHPPGQRRTAPVEGVAQYLDELRNYKDPEGYEPTLSWQQARDKKKMDRLAREKKLLTEDLAAWEMEKDTDPKKRGDPYKTLFVARLPHDITTEELERQFGRFGAIDHIRIVEKANASPDAPLKKRMTGYAFIVYEREEDLKAAYKDTGYLTIGGRKVVVEVEKGRTTGGWRPRRFGGGLGGRHYTKAPPRSLGAPAGGYGGPPAGPVGFARGGGPGGFRGGRGGGFGGGFDRGGGYGGDRGGGGFRGGFAGPPRGGGGYGGRPGAGIGHQSNGWGAPDGAPSGPRGSGGGRGGFGGGGGGRFGDDRRGGGSSGANMEPLGSRERGSYRDRDGGRDRNDRDRDRDGGYGGRDSRKRPHEGDGGYDSRNSRPRY
ncbi:hypothetical protein P154DRAFT_522990 [Amniculicola lignicola CBS 123094]|uniref:RRM domain-containing protein n=1 Tax=Amniculicola lignicola CBS 123094 TaxID=1392246 RepID=A0A6A5WEM8_9PLEO|nr:hypothetical protein P154DRAFT_522990 [Amniculicola lignicola CBS 123094]